jgi:Holliday junction resolvase
MTNYQNGANRERRVVNSLKEQGFDLVFRSAGSHSPVDLFALDIKTKQIWLIQCKPKSLSSNGKNKIEDSIRQFEGCYSVKTKCISLVSD